MTPQEKANQLVNKFLKMHFIAGGIGINKKQAIQCANFASDEIIDELKNENRFDWLHERKGGEEYVIYWEQVKEALSKIDCA